MTAELEIKQCPKCDSWTLQTHETLEACVEALKREIKEALLQHDLDLARNFKERLIDNG